VRTELARPEAHGECCEPIRHGGYGVPVRRGMRDGEISKQAFSATTVFGDNAAPLRAALALFKPEKAHEKLRKRLVLAG
jgi:hypothetical protein